LAADPRRVFRALTDGTELRQWFAEATDVEPGPGGRYRFWGRHTLGTPSAAEARQAITRFEPDAALGFSWDLHGTATEVLVALKPNGRETSLTIQHRVSGDLGVDRQKELIDDHWRIAVGNLIAHIAGGKGILRPDFAGPVPEIRLAIHINAPPPKVFRALIEPALLTRWFGGRSVVVEPRVGGRYDLDWSYKVEGRDVVGGPTMIHEFVPDQRLVLDWPDWRGNPAVTGQTIAFELAPDGQRTRLAFVHGGFLRPTDWSDYPFGWAWFLNQLKAVAEE
jgi:uncharacterized protein YndB with AHSA1/START domain